MSVIRYSRKRTVGHGIILVASPAGTARFPIGRSCLR